MDVALTLSDIRHRGYRLTKTRRAIVEIFSNATIPLTVNEVEKRLFKRGLRADKTTIYRELQFFCDNDILIKVYLDPKEISYESSSLRHHHHLICERCGTVDTVTNCMVENVQDDVYKRKGFNIKRHTLEFYGVCGKCSKSSAN
jgi:Fur family ferric uptake transcriptional regulator